MIWVAIFRGNGSDSREVESMEAARASIPMWDALQRLRVCTECNHPECPHCQTWCDVLGEDHDMCCDGTCSYIEAKPFDVEVRRR